MEDLLAKCEALAAEAKQLRLRLERLQIERDALAARLYSSLRRLHGRSCERFHNPDQCEFDFVAPAAVAAGALKDERARQAEPEAKAAAAAQEEKKATAASSRRRGRRPLPAVLPVVEKRIELPQEERVCDCGCQKPLVQIGQKVTDQLEYEPARFYILRMIRPVLASPHCDERSTVKPLPPLPPRPIERGRPGASVLAHIAVSKYCDHLPLYRLEQIFARSGVQLSRKTQCDWLGEIAFLLEPIVEAQVRWMLSHRHLQADESPVKVMDPELPGKTRTGFVWVYALPWAEVAFNFRTSRARAGPSIFLESFCGHLQTDGYAGYDEIVRLRGIVRLACWAHVRRAFFKALPHHPGHCTLILGLIQRLYLIERQAKADDLVPAARAALRQEQAPPVLVALKTAIQSAHSSVLPASLLAKAASYALGLWSELTVYLQVGELEIDNNSVEHAIRALAIGRKNWLFLGHPEGGGRRLDVFYTLIGTCKRLGVNPFEYLKDVIDQVSVHPASRVLELIPRFWQAARAAASLPAAAVLPSPA